jgi:hypothetical protein
LASSPTAKLSCGWIDDLPEFPRGNVYLIKVHQISAAQAFRASHVFYSYRDLRDALVSYSRKFGEPTIHLARQWISDFQWAKGHADLMIRYEDMMSDPRAAVMQVVRTLGVNADVNEIMSRLPDGTENDAAPSSYSKATLLHHGHRTDTRAGEWSTVLHADLLRQLRTEFAWWFRENGYEE